MQSRCKLIAFRAGHALSKNTFGSLGYRANLHSFSWPAPLSLSHRTMKIPSTASIGINVWPKQYRCLTGKDSSSCDASMKVEITLTRFSKNQEKTGDDVAVQQPIVVDNTEGDANEGGTSDNSKPKPKKNQQQEAEEELYMLQTHVRQHFQHANYTEALATSQEILEKSLELFGERHPAVASAHNNIGLMNKMMGQFSLSRESFHAALDIYQEIVGKDHASYAAALNNLGNLDRAQSIMDEDLSGIERMQMNDSAVEYFDEAYKIRKVELGAEHVHTVTSRSNLGGSIAAQVLQGEVFRQKMLKEQQEEREKSGEGSGNAENTKDINYVMSKYTKEKWDVAEEHLRAAFRTAVKNPRGEKVAIPHSSPANTLSEGDSIKKKSWKNMTKKEKIQAAKLRKKQKREANTVAQKIIDGNNLGVGHASICTLSSAASAMNLAVFLKSRADLVANAASSNSDMYSSMDSGDLYAEAKNLYVGALRVRNALKGPKHPDTIATKFSLAELIGALGDEKGANNLRQELLDTYEVEEYDGGQNVAQDQK